MRLLYLAVECIFLAVYSQLAFFWEQRVESNDYYSPCWIAELVYLFKGKLWFLSIRPSQHIVPTLKLNGNDKWHRTKRNNFVFVPISHTMVTYYIQQKNMTPLFRIRLLCYRLIPLACINCPRFPNNSRHRNNTKAFSESDRPWSSFCEFPENVEFGTDNTLCRRAGFRARLTECSWMSAVAFGFVSQLQYSSIATYKNSPSIVLVRQWHGTLVST